MWWPEGLQLGAMNTTEALQKNGKQAIISLTAVYAMAAAIRGSQAVLRGHGWQAH
jgi:hypothetical protein